MRSLGAIFACLALALAAAPAAHAHGLPATHGPDPKSIDLEQEAPAPEGGPGGDALPVSLAGERPLATTAKKRRKSRRKVQRRQADAVLNALPSSWCGEQRERDDREHERDTGGPRYHAIYAIPADGNSRLGSVANTLQTDAFQASSLLEQLYGRAIRFDMGTSCGPQYLDITLLRLPQTTAELEALGGTSTGTLEAVTSALQGAGFDASNGAGSWSVGQRRTQNFVVWLDAPGPRGACGQGTLYDDPTRADWNANNYGGRVAMVFRSGSGFCGSNTVRHEIGHNLGALQSRAPHSFDGAHCNDAYEDTMCYASSPRRGSGAFQRLYFDYGNDDYWDPPSGNPLRHWTVNLSRFVCPTADCNAMVGRPGDADGDGILDESDNCPETANPTQANSFGDRRGDACEPRSIARTRRRGGKWKVAIRVEGEGSAVVSLRCGRGRRSRTVYRRETRLPATVRARVRCGSKPVAAVTQR